MQIFGGVIYPWASWCANTNNNLKQVHLHCTQNQIVLPSPLQKNIFIPFNSTNDFNA